MPRGGRVSLRQDVNHPGHEVTGVFELAASAAPPVSLSICWSPSGSCSEDPKESALVACRCSRAPALETGLCEDTWTLDLMSISCGGHAETSASKQAVCVSYGICLKTRPWTTAQRYSILAKPQTAAGSEKSNHVQAIRSKRGFAGPCS